jgi:hypothetical protein
MIAYRRSRAGGNLVSSAKAAGFPPMRERRGVEIGISNCRFDMQTELIVNLFTEVKMNAVEFNAVVRNGHIALPDNQQSWNDKNIKVILIDVSGSLQTAKPLSADDFFDVAGMWAQRDDVTQESLRRVAWRSEPK